jgi:hypothetical protein
MANVYKDISEFVQKVAATGNEEFQVSATEKVTATQIANKVQLSQVLMSGFGAVSIKGVEKIKDTNSLLGALKILYSLSGNGLVKVVGNSENCFGLISINTAGTLAFGILFDIRSSTPPSIFIRDGFGLTGGASLKNLTDNQWIAEVKKGKKIPMESDIRVVEITDFAIPGLNITKDGESFLFYANDASNIPNSNHGATSFVGVAIASPIFITGDQRLLYYMMIDTARGMFYTGRANLEDDVVAWNDTPVTRLGQAVQVTAFTEGALSSLLHTFKAGDFIPFYTGNVTASTANQFPESGAFNGFISMGSNEGDYFQIFAFKSGSPNAYMGACIGSTTQWTKASSGLNVYTISESESQNQKIDASRVEELKKSELVLFPNEVGYTPYFKVSVDNSKAYFITGIIPINSQGQPGLNNGEEPPFEQIQTVMIEIDLTTYDITIWPYPVVKKEWLQLSAGGGGGGLEKLSAWSDSRYVSVNVGAGTGDYVDFPLTRALKSTDVILVTWKKQNASSKDTEIAGHAIFNPGAYSYDCCLDLLENYQSNGDYYGLFINQVTSEVGVNMLTLYAESEGANSYGPSYLITGVYNISGK